MPLDENLLKIMYKNDLNPAILTLKLMKFLEYALKSVFVETFNEVISTKKFGNCFFKAIIQKIVLFRRCPEVIFTA